MILNIQWDFNMNRITFIILVISCASFIGFFIISAAIYKINQKKWIKLLNYIWKKGFVYHQEHT